MRGCRDLLGKVAANRRALVNAFAAHCERHAFAEIETPILERAALYGSLGETSDVVAGEMYTIEGCDPRVVLRPEGTAGVLRALAEVGLVKRMTSGGTRVWYAGPMFRRERPQRKRWRQFWQMGVEWVGEDGVGADAEVVEMAVTFLKGVGAGGQLRINTLGNKEEREKFNNVLHEWLKPRYWALSEISRERFDNGNCMRILDSKLTEDVETLRAAPRLADFVGEQERARFEDLKVLLEEGQVEYVVDERLVRGLDYYTSTAFEIDSVDRRAVCAGGRYDGVVEGCGVGFAIGLDRIEKDSLWEESCGVEAYERELEGGVAILAATKGAEHIDSEIGKACRRIARELRRAGVKAVTRLEGTRLNKSLPRVIRNGAVAVVLVGEKEVENGHAQVRFVTEDAQGDTSVLYVQFVDVVATVCKRQKLTGAAI